MSTKLARKPVPTIDKHAIKQRGHVPLFLDGTEIEVHGKQFEEASPTYSENTKYRMRAAFLGKVQLCGRLSPGNQDSVGDWRTHLAEDIVLAIPKDAPVWAMADNSFYRGELVAELNSLGWDWSISLTNTNNMRPVLALIDEDAFWTPLPGNDYEETHEVCCKPAGKRGSIRGGATLGRCGWRTWPFSAIYRDCDIQPAEVVKRHPLKQDFENGFNGPLIELDLHHPPSSKFHGNQLYYTCGLIA